MYDTRLNVTSASLFSRFVTPGTELENTGRLWNQIVVKADNLQGPHQGNTHSIHVG